MGKAGCAVYNCQPDKYSGRYRFPNPNKFPELFTTWILLCNLRVPDLDKNLTFERYRVCGKHFMCGDFGNNCKLKKGVRPSLFLPSSETTSASCHVNLDRDYFATSTTSSPQDSTPSTSSK